MWISGRSECQMLVSAGRCRSKANSQTKNLRLRRFESGIPHLTLSEGRSKEGGVANGESAQKLAFSRLVGDGSWAHARFSKALGRFQAARGLRIARAPLCRSDPPFSGTPPARGPSGARRPSQRVRQRSSFSFSVGGGAGDGDKAGIFRKCRLLEVT